MAVSTMFYKDIEYFRITRTWDYKKIEVQKYVRIFTHKLKSKRDKLRSEALEVANLIDESLAQRQRLSRILKQNNGEIYFHPTGKIVGINRVAHTRVHNDTGSTTDVHEFAVRYNKRNGKHPRSGSISIHKHGLEYAFELAVKKFAAFADIDGNKPLMKLLMDSFKYYQNDPTLIKHNFDYDGRGKRDTLPDLEARLKIDFIDTANKKSNINKNHHFKEEIEKQLNKYLCDNPSTDYPARRKTGAKYTGDFTASKC